MQIIKELNFPNDFIYRHRRIFQIENYDLFVFYENINSRQKDTLLAIFNGQSVDKFLTDVNGWMTFFNREKPQPIGFQLYSPSTLIAASLINGRLSWSYQYCDDSTLSGHAADPLDADVVDAFCHAARDLDTDVFRFVKLILQQKSKVCSTDEKEARLAKEERSRLGKTGDLGPIFRGKREEDE